MSFIEKTFKTLLCLRNLLVASTEPLPYSLGLEKYAPPHSLQLFSVSSIFMNWILFEPATDYHG
jgi:hypothetical protein